MSITIGWWGIPTFITIAAIYIALRESPEQRGDYDFGSGIIAVLYLAAAVIVSLVAWLVWAILA